MERQAREDAARGRLPGVDVVAVLRRAGGVARTADLLALVPRAALRAAVRRGEVVHVGRGRYALPTAARARRAAAEVDGYVCLLSAAAHRGWGIAREPERPQVAVPRHRDDPGPLGVDVEVHRWSLPLSDVDAVATGALRTVLDCARELPLADALAAADSALRSGDVTREALCDAAAGAPPHVRRVLDLADPRASGPLESVLRAIAVEEGWDVVPQWAVTVAGTTYHPDLADPFRGVVLEADSFAWHGDRDALARDVVRYNALVAAGWRVLRFTWEQVMQSPSYVRAVLRAMDAEAAA